MKPFKRFTLACLAICFISYSQAQTIDCNSNFWTITVDGHIQQWSLNSGSISGGDTILSGGGSSLSYCNHNNVPTFYSNNFSSPFTGFAYYDSGWVNIPTPYLPVNNNGGHLNDQYYMVEGGVIQIIQYWDGVNSVTVDSLHVRGEYFAGTQDIAVDTAGQAWIFTGSIPSGVDSLKVYDQNGRINAYSVSFNTIGYGSFFLNETLYIGAQQDSIFPVILNGSTAQLGTPIHFPANNFTDMASCQENGSTTSIPDDLRKDINLFPNPSTGSFSLDLGENRPSVKVSITDLRGKSMQTRTYQNSQLIQFNLEAPPGIYLVKIESGEKRSVLRLLKE